jgi:hypothetical protein
MTERGASKFSIRKRPIPRFGPSDSSYLSLFLPACNIRPQPCSKCQMEIVSQDIDEIRFHFRECQQCTRVIRHQQKCKCKNNRPVRYFDARRTNTHQKYRPPHRTKSQQSFSSIGIVIPPPSSVTDSARQTNSETWKAERPNSRSCRAGASISKTRDRRLA